MANRFVVSAFTILTTSVVAAACGDVQAPTAASGDDSGALTPDAADHARRSTSRTATFSGFTYCVAAGNICSYLGLREVRLVGSATSYVSQIAYASVPCAGYGFGNKYPSGSSLHCEYGKQKMDTLNNPFPGMVAGMKSKVIIPLGAPGGSKQQIQNTGWKGTYADGSGSFRTTCDLAKMDFIDPIVFPGKANASHLHMFFGNTGVNASSTTQSISTTGNGTCKGGTANRTAYWTPAMIDTRTGNVITPTYATIYYKSGYNMDPKTIKPMPTGLRMISGNAKATSQSQQPYGIDWSCLNGGSDGHGAIPTTCQKGDFVRLTVIFPQCWDGKNLDSPDHKSHMVFPNYNSRPRSTCPSTHPIPLPEMTEHFDFPVANTGDSQYWRLASDMYSSSIKGGYSAHADWMMGWDPAIMKTMVTQCLNRAVDCGVGAIGDGRELY